MSPTDEVASIIDSLQRCGLTIPEIARQSGLGYSVVLRGAAREMRAPSYRCVTSLQSLAERVGPPPSRMVRR